MTLRQQIEAEHTEKFAEYQAMPFHLQYSKRCKTCGRVFIGGDWRLAEIDYCSDKCHRASYKKIDAAQSYRLKLFWRDFGNDFDYLEED